MKKEKVLWNGDIYDHYIDKDGYHILETYNENNVLISFQFMGTKTKEEIEKDLINTILSKT